MSRYHDPDMDTQSLSSVSGASASFCSAASGSCFSEGSSFEIESEVGRDALVQICCSSLSRLLDFPDSQLEVLLGSDDELAEEDGGVNVARNIASSLKMMKRSIGSGLHAISHMYHHQRHHHHPQEVYTNTQVSPGHHHRLVFGAPLTSSAQIVLLQIMAHVEGFTGLEGVFRKSGSKPRVDQLVQQLREKEFGEILPSGYYKPHDYTSMLKQFFSELPEPLFLKRHLGAYMQTSDLASPGATTKSLQLLMLMLPPSHRIVAQHLLQLLSLVASSAARNKMDAHNLALVFAPTLFLSGTFKAQDYSTSETLDKVVSLLEYTIRNPLEIFEVPHEVQVVAERYCKKRDTTQEEDIALDMCSTYCQQECSDDFHAAGQQRAMTEMAALYEAVKNMPDGPQKSLFLKKFESKSSATPSSVKKSKTKSNKENLTTPKAHSKSFRVHTIHVETTVNYGINSPPGY
ncbi:Rho GTPase-activating protein 19 [Geodia barretti]|uniref:Rho GTPase-activating protein 19 n=1 Tax=Geodia barretti TaxID=519541 RepID=A0AA35QWF7_GEOBA|nr:Rho GTPase-activating protein 19 [Geodia barretti]